MTANRLVAEIENVNRNFPGFTQFVTRSGFVGFAGTLAGKQRLYEVVIKADMSTYPAEEPKTYIDPKPESHHWIPQDGTPMEERHLCYTRDEKRWDPARSTFANCILIAARYIHDFD
jgi:hypothetical protein